MKVLFGTYQAVSIIHGGPRVQILQTKKELEKLGVEVDLFQAWENVPIDRYALFHLFSANLGTFHLARNVRTKNIPLVTSPIFFTRHSPALIRSVLTVNRVLQKFRSGIWTDYRYTEQICRWSQSVLPNTTEEARLVRFGLGIPDSSISVVPNGVEARFEFGDPSLFKKKYGLEHFILNVGHIGPERKNVLGLIRAVKTLNHPTVIIGQIHPGPYADLCLKEARENKNVLIIDGLDNSSELLASAYAACDTFVLPSLFETPGIAALEAGLAGAKIVITPFGGTKDYFTDFARYANPFSIQSIKQEIEHALNRKKDSLLQNHIRQNFLWSRVAEKTLAVYRAIGS